MIATIIISSIFVCFKIEHLITLSLERSHSRKRRLKCSERLECHAKGTAQVLKKRLECFVGDGLPVTSVIQRYGYFKSPFVFNDKKLTFF
jgi:hypothetical protein